MRTMCRLQLNDRKTSTNFMFILGLIETMDQLAMIDSVGWFGDVMRREDVQ